MTRADEFTQLHGVQVTYRDGLGNYLKISHPTNSEYMLNINEHTICIKDEDLMKMINDSLINPRENDNVD